MDEPNPVEPAPQAAEPNVFLQVDTNVICFSVFDQGGLRNYWSDPVLLKLGRTSVPAWFLPVKPATA